MGLLTLLILGLLGFGIYFVFKQIQFFLTATDLYKQIVSRQDSMIKLLSDIRDGTKRYDAQKPPIELQSDLKSGMEDSSGPA
jgi:hypothetical protein